MKKYEKHIQNICKKFSQKLGVCYTSKLINSRIIIKSKNEVIDLDLLLRLFNFSSKYNLNVFMEKNSKNIILEKKKNE